ncbi:MAG: hypothetical protein HRU28_13120 [Rhizobiales bacterium]|nr:hypothetical protein [Hyphomicrobiales bacterium]
MNKISLILAGAMLLATTVVTAAIEVTEGDEAVNIYESQKNEGVVLVQKDKSFFLRTESGDESINKKTFTLKSGQLLFLINDERRYVHNIYDTTDKGWVLKKQKPSEVAVVVFDKVGKHKLKCAIHPRMKVTVIVE